MKKNYAAWDIDPEDFYAQKSDRERMAFLVRFAVLAPSSHNSQPWRAIVRDDGMTLVPEFARELRVSDPHHRHMLVSLGCAAENVCIAADYFGLGASCEAVPAEAGLLGIRISITGSGRPKGSSNHRIFAVMNRRSNRNPFTKKLLEQGFLDWASHEMEGNACMAAFTDPAIRNAVADLFMASRIRAFDSAAFRGELADYKRTNLTSSPTGMPGFTMGFSTVISLIAPFAIRHWNVMRLIRKEEMAILKEGTPIFMFVTTAGNASADWIDAGRLLERVLIEAEHRGIQASMSAIPPDPVPLQKMLGIADRPQMFLRCGYAEKIPGHAPRLPFGAFLQTENPAATADHIVELK